MSFVTHLSLAILAFAGHVSLSSLTTSSIPLNLLSVLTIVCVWLNTPRLIAYRLLPAALLIDILQPTRMPITLGVVLAVWGVATLVQKHWLTNHSLASLAGIALVATIVRLVTTWSGLAIAEAIGTSSVSVAAAWTWRENLLRLVVESCITIGLGAGWLGLRRTFHYGTR